MPLASEVRTHRIIVSFFYFAKTIGFGGLICRLWNCCLSYNHYDALRTTFELKGFMNTQKLEFKISQLLQLVQI